MRVITIKQPWASLICKPRINDPSKGIKDIENRTWPTKIRGQVLIHAGLSIDETAIDKISYFSDNVARKVWFDINDNKLPLGAIIGSVEIVDCVVNHPSVWAEKGYFDLSSMEGIEYKEIYNWVLAHPIQLLEPIPVKGKQGFWEYPINEINSKSKERI